MKLALNNSKGQFALITISVAISGVFLLFELCKAVSANWNTNAIWGQCYTPWKQKTVGFSCFNSDIKGTLTWNKFPILFSHHSSTSILTHFMSLSFFFLWKQQEIRDFLMFSGGMEKEQWHLMVKLSFRNIFLCISELNSVQPAFYIKSFLVSCIC